MSSIPLLDNVVWHALSGSHAHFAAGNDRVRRYARGFSPIVAFADPDAADFDTLRTLFEPGEAFYVDAWTGPVPGGWQLVAESTMFRMVYDRPAPHQDAAPDAVPLVPSHYDQALALATLTRPGPFGPRTPELGEYFGYFEGERLVAMAGERMLASPLREVSGVCTHPEFQGRGLARRLVMKLVHRELGRGETPFLHVMRDNVAARALYRDLGFREYRESPVRVLARA